MVGDLQIVRTWAKICSVAAGRCQFIEIRRPVWIGYEVSSSELRARESKCQRARAQSQCQC